MDPETAHHGVTLARFAAVRAALAEPFVLRRVLAVEGLALDDFRAADIAWKKEIARHPDKLLPVYRRELASAEDWLLRIVVPLHEDVEAWADFLCAFTLKPAEVLQHAQMSTNDVSRLIRFWTAQTARDGDLASRAEARMKRGFVTLPQIRPEPRKLRRSRGSGAPSAKVEPESRSVDRARESGADRARESPFDRAVESQRRVEVPSFLSDKASSDLPPVSGQPSSGLLPSFMAAQAHAAAIAGGPVFSTPVATPVSLAPIASTPMNAGGTQDVSAFLDGPALPFDSSAPPSIPPVSGSRPVTPTLNSAHSTEAGGTQDVSALLGGAISPFDRPAPKPPDAGRAQSLDALLGGAISPFDRPAPKTPEAGGTQDVSAILGEASLPFDKPAPKPPDAGGTQDVSSFLEGPSLPFVPEKKAAPTQAFSAPPAASSGRESPPPARKAPSAGPPPPLPDAGGTTDVSAFLQSTATPFEKSAPTPDAGGTQDVSALLAGPSLPFAAEQKSKASPGAAPPAGSRAVSSTPPPESLRAVAPAPPESLRAVAPPADIPLRQYASLCVDIGNQPDRVADTLARYRLTPEAKKAIDARYRERFVAEPALFGEFRRACDAYQAWLSQQAPRSSSAPQAPRSSAPPQSLPVSARPQTPPVSVRPQTPQVAFPPQTPPIPPPQSLRPAQQALSIPQLTVEQYAALSVDLQIAPAHRAAVLHHHRLTEAQLAALGAAWSRYLTNDPAARDAYQRAEATYRAYRMRGSR